MPPAEAGAPVAERLAAATGFAFDLDGTLVERSPDGTLTALPGAVELLERIVAGGRPAVVFTNASHAAPARIAAACRAAGLPIGEEQVLTPICSAISYFERHLAGLPVFAIATEAARERLEGAGVRLVGNGEAENAAAVLVAHSDRADFEELEAASRAVLAGAEFLTASWARAYAGAEGPILSRGAMLTAAVAKAAAAEPQIVGKPSRAAVELLGERLGTPTERAVVVGDDLTMDIPLGKMGGSLTVFVSATGMGGDPSAAAPDLVLAEVAELLPLLPA